MLQHDMHPEAIIWDLDGTLVESAPDLATALNTLLNEQGQHSHPVENVRPMIGGGVAKLIERGFRAAGAPLDERALHGLIPRFMIIYSECCTRSTALVPHARDALLYFYNAGVPQGLCTNKPITVTRQILNALDISGFFGSIIGGDSTAEKKPHPLPLLACMTELGINPERAIMIGDSGADVGAARAAGMPVVLVPDGYTGVPVDSLGADYVLENLREIPKFLLPHGPLLQSA
jgi:phosphoglycolate phosphatase